MQIIWTQEVNCEINHHHAEAERHQLADFYLMVKGDDIFQRTSRRNSTC